MLNAKQLVGCGLNGCVVGALSGLAGLPLWAVALSILLVAVGNLVIIAGSDK